MKEEIKKLEGRIWIVGDSIDTDLIVPSRVLTEQNSEKMLEATLELVIPDFHKLVKKGDFIIAGKNFGCGSSREEAVYVLKQLGVGGIIAFSFARIFFRNCINLGLLPIVIKKENGSSYSIPSDLGNQGDLISIDLKNNVIYNHISNRKFTFHPFTPFLQKYLDKNGAFFYVKEQLKHLK
ncbi:3-isopropylmalate dehydratase [Promethearchaeum syntrophicum]|uniref:3-isopropylmalate dehydratase n=1 Tax=Promethearchaeum syntrophicum TaxID=2594042 RepID=A0A5B9DES5_9ARCH|nr:3-isopropylmalate dehydratase [Candidatus Prometheoarchaeum syntrophicum]QEE17829.1 Isopropylmalate/citramalate isomerase small subunit [Candidatus Prometheoarchaeum syntrophicum]